MTFLQIAVDSKIAGENGFFATALNNVYNSMKFQTSLFINIGRSIGGIGALFYISFRIWKHMASGEPINFFPLLRPFMIGFCILFFPMLMDIINGLLYLILARTQEEANSRNFLTNLNASPCNSIQFWNPYTWVNCGNYLFLRSIAELIQYVVLTVLNVLRVLFLLILTTIGPIAFGLSIFDGFQETLTNWIKRYIGIYMWLPMLNILKSISNKLVDAIDLSKTEIFSSYPISSDWLLYVAFQLALVVCYSKVPEFSEWIFSPGIGGSSGSAGGMIGQAQKFGTAIATKGASLLRKG